MTKISISMIVKNESSCLEKCLKSIEGLGEIVIVDTGSTDNTIEIAKKYTDKVYSGEEYLWGDDFAHSRNQCLDLCDGDWVFIIDADEYLEPGSIPNIHKCIEKTDKDALYFNLLGEGSTEIHRSIRLFRNHKGIHWKGKIHNYLSLADGDDTGIVIIYGYSPAHKQDPNRALRILHKEVVERPDCIREKFYLAREYYYRKLFRLAILHYDYYLESAIWGPEMADAWVMKARCHIGLNEFDKARDCALQAININVDYKEPYMILASLSGPKNKAKWLEHGENCTNKDVLFIT